jgi:hypothetical protein
MAEAAAFDINLALNSMYIIGTLTSWACECPHTRMNPAERTQSCTASAGEQSILLVKCLWRRSSVSLAFSGSSRAILTPHTVLVRC